MEDIAPPALLDPDRPRLIGKEEATSADLAARADLLETALREVCGYAQHLWTQVDNARRYLMNSLPDPTADDDTARLLTAPRGPDDDSGWQAWQTAYAALTASLAGTHADAGYGKYEASQAALARRGPRHASPRLAELTDIATAHRLHIEEQTAAWHDPARDTALAAADPDDPELPASLRPDAESPRTDKANERQQAGTPEIGGWASRSRPFRVVLAAVAAVLMLRGLRPRRVIVAQSGPALDAGTAHGPRGRE